MRKIIVANWKMNGSLGFIETFFSTMIPPLTTTPHHVILCPPFPYLRMVNEKLKGTRAWLGAQNCHISPEGAFTGEVSAPMLADIGCQFIIIGHSERRTVFEEGDALVQTKVRRAHESGLTAIVCIGESLKIRQEGQATQKVVEQLQASLSPSATPHNTFIAYEPIWAIGTGLTPSLAEITQMHHALSDALTPPLPLLYGGSVTDKNVTEILSLPHVDGVLVGGASLKADVFQKMI